MSEVASRPSASRGRGSGRGGRGGFTGRGGRRPNGDKVDQKAVPDDIPTAFDDAGDYAELRKLYGDKTSVIREMFPDWSEVDVLFALQETNGDQNEAVTRIAEGTMSQWGEVSKVKKPAKAKAKEGLPTTATEQNMPAGKTSRGGRGALDGTRGRGRATDRGGRGSARGRSAPAAQTTSQRTKENEQLSVPTEESTAWGDDAQATTSTGHASTAANNHTLPSTLESTPAATPQAKTWASMLRQTAPPKPKSKPVTAEVAETQKAAPHAPAESHIDTTAAIEPEQEITPVAQPATLADPPLVVEPEAALPPSKDELTKTNLEQVVDESKPPATATAASTAADSWDPRQNAPSATATPLSAAQQQHQAPRNTSSGYAASAVKATADRVVPRVPSFQRRVLDQEEAVRMPGHRDVDRTAVQFGAFNLGSGEDDVDGDREEPETRAQPPADSPVSHPRASLPPVAQPPALAEQMQQKPIASIPPGMAPPGSLTGHPSVASTQQYGRFAQGGPQDVVQKPSDPFAHQGAVSSQPPFDGLSAQAPQPSSHQGSSAFTSAPSEYSSYYTANHQDRYNSYYGGHYGQHGQDSLGPQQRNQGGYGGPQHDNLSQYPQSGSMHGQPRLGGPASAAAAAAAAANESGSGHSTPNPASQSQHQQGQHGQQQNVPGSQPHSHGQQQQQQQQQYPGYNHPYYSNPYYHQYYSAYGQGGYPYGKGGMYGQPYGVSPGGPYDHTSSPASFNSLGSVGEYGRAGSAQAGAQSSLGGSGSAGGSGAGGSSSGFGSVHDTFSRGGSSFQSQGSFGSQGPQSGNNAGADLKPFGDAKGSSGPSPSLGGARPGSATNTASSGQGGLPPPQGGVGAGGYGGYPSSYATQNHSMHGSGAYGMGGNNGGSTHGSSPYDSYGQGGFGGSGYYGGNQQQRGGWGGNYH